MKWIVFFMICSSLLSFSVYAQEQIDLKEFLLSPGQNVTGYFNFSEKIGNTVDIKLKQYNDDREAMMWIDMPRSADIVKGKVGLKYTISVPETADIGHYYLILSMTDNAGTDNYKIHIQLERPIIKFFYSHVLFFGLVIIAALVGVAIWLFKDVTSK